MKLSDILKDSNYRLTQFSDKKIIDLEKAIYTKHTRGKEVPFINCIVRKREIRLTPEEVIRQLFLKLLIEDYQYPVSRIELESIVTFGRDKKRADIIVFDKQQTTSPYIIVELKKPKLKDGKEQLKSYCNATGAQIGVWSNGQSISFYHRKDPNYFKDIPDIPKASEKLSDILTERWSINDLIDKDKLRTERKSLKDLILEMEDEVLANAGVDVFEELFKLIFTKLFDEMESGRDKARYLEFRNYGYTDSELKVKIQEIFDMAKKKWEGVFSEDSRIELTASHLAVCVSSLQDVKLFNSNLDVIDDAFEYLINKSSKGEKGQYFTPRYVIDMCVKMLNPKEHETMIDTAAGSCGFPVHTMFHVWKDIMKDLNLPESHLFTLEQKPPRCVDYVNNKVYAIDFDEKSVRVARTLNLIAGDGQTNVFHLNTLDWERWDEKYNDSDWTDVYGTGWKNIRKLLKNPKPKSISVEEEHNGKIYVKEKKVYQCQDFTFDVLMANPPFAGDIKESRILAKYELAKNVFLEKLKADRVDKKFVIDATEKEPTFPEFLGASGEKFYKLADGTYRRVKVKNSNKMGRDILFIERNLDFLKPGGRMAIVLPQGRFNNSSDKRIREYIAEHCRILAVVGLHGNVFKPHTGTKTSVLFVQKWDEKLCPKVDDYPIFFATMQEPSKDNSGDKIYLMKKDVKNKAHFTADEDGNVKDESASEEGKDFYESEPKEGDEYFLDNHDHLIVKHDLFNHDGLTQDGIAEAFAEFAKKEGLSFF